MSRNKPLTVASGNFMLRDFAIFQIKLILDGGKDSFAFLGVHRCGPGKTSEAFLLSGSHERTL
jgi:hypothetical protein